MTPTAIPLTPLEQAVLDCRDCRIYEERHHEHLARARGLEPDSEIWTYSMRNGMALDFGTGPVPLWSDYVLCPKHEAEARAA